MRIVMLKVWHALYLKNPVLFDLSRIGPFCQRDHCPFRPHDNDAGADVFMPYDCIAKPGEILKIPLGYGIEISDGYAGYVFPRSSMTVKELLCELPPIDSGYRGEIHAIISNVSNQEHSLKKNTGIGQLVITPVIIADFVFEHGKQRGKILLEVLEYKINSFIVRNRAAQIRCSIVTVP